MDGLRRLGRSRCSRVVAVAALVLALPCLAVPDGPVGQQVTADGIASRVDVTAPQKFTMSFSRAGVTLPVGTEVHVELGIDYSDGSDRWWAFSDRYNKKTQLRVGPNGYVEWQLTREYPPTKVLSYWLVAWFDDREGGWPFRRWWSLPRQIDVNLIKDGVAALPDLALFEIPLIEAGWLLDREGKAAIDGAVRIRDAARNWANGELERVAERFPVNRYLIRRDGALRAAKFL